jgi:hypothetical protein
MKKTRILRRKEINSFFFQKNESFFKSIYFLSNIIFLNYITFSFKSKLLQYKSPQNTDNNNTICNLRRNVYMKATGIVRRIDAGVIKTPRIYIVKAR